MCSGQDRVAALESIIIEMGHGQANVKIGSKRDLGFRVWEVVHCLWTDEWCRASDVFDFFWFCIVSMNCQVSRSFGTQLAVLFLGFTNPQS